MMIQSRRISEVKPDILPREGGGWIAVSPRWARFSIGVTAETEDAVRIAFRLTFERWVSLIDDTKISAST